MHRNRLAPPAEKPAEGAPAAEAKPAEAKPDAAPKPPATMKIDFDGISNRVARVPLGADNYFGLSVKTGHLLYVTGGAGYYGRQGDRTPSLKIYSIKDRKETNLVDDIRGYALSDDGSKVLVGQGPGYNLYDATPLGERSRKAVATTGLYVDRVPAEEWNQIFNEVWRRYRDWFYVSNMHGYDWAGVARAVQADAQVRGPSFGSQLRDQRDDRRVDGATRVHRRRRFPDSASSAFRFAGRAL